MKGTSSYSDWQCGTTKKIVTISMEVYSLVSKERGEKSATIGYARYNSHATSYTGSKVTAREERLLAEPC